jgi:type II secretory pathway pseudopilin PulG
MMQDRLAKYKIGLAVIGLFTLVILIMVLAQAGAAKQDKETYDKANKVANKLNSYIDDKQRIPASLNVTGVKDIPDTITYKRISTTKYRFCVTYKADSSGFNATDIETQLIYGAYGGGDYDSYKPDDFLYIDSHHKKGENCQTIKPYIYQENTYDDYYQGSTIQDPPVLTN